MRGGVDRQIGKIARTVLHETFRGDHGGVIGAIFFFGKDEADARRGTLPWGIPVATVAIDGGKNAGLLAAEILAVEDEALRARLRARRDAEAERLRAKDAKLQQTLADQLK